MKEKERIERYLKYQRWIAAEDKKTQERSTNLGKQKKKWRVKQENCNCCWGCCILGGCYIEDKELEYDQDIR